MAGVLVCAGLIVSRNTLSSKCFHATSRREQCRSRLIVLAEGRLRLSTLAVNLPWNLRAVHDAPPPSGVRGGRGLHKGLGKG